LISIAILITTAAVLHTHGITNIESSAQAAEALKPLTGRFAEVIFALGIAGTGLLAIPVLAGSTAYAIAEGLKWPVGLARQPKQAVAFYTILALAGAAAIAIDFLPHDPIKALYWSAVINGVVAAPFMVLIMVLCRHKGVMGPLAIKGWLYCLGWASTAAMTLYVVGMLVSMIKG
jgi:Mn2+/Fe2+ NRAMP family transporter